MSDIEGLVADKPLGRTLTLFGHSARHVPME
jgi:hypothetical protein